MGFQRKVLGLVAKQIKIQDNRMFSMQSNGKNIFDLISYSEGGITSKVISKSARSEVTLFCMAKGTALSEHRASREGLIYILEGNGAFVLNNKKLRMKSGVLISMEKGAPHSLKVKENTSFLLILF